MRRALFLLFAVSLVALPSRGPGDTGLEGVGRPMPYLVSSLGLGEADGRWDTALADLATAGVSAIRRDFLWSRIERGTEPRYDFTAEDFIVDTAAAHGLDVLAILAYGNPRYSRLGGLAQSLGTGGGIPPFGVGAAYLFPPDPEYLPEYRAFAAATAGHFAGRVRLWEVWNEENVGWRFWPPHEDATAYAPLLRAGAAGLRAGDPGALVSLGGVFYPEIPPGLPEEGGLRYLGHVFDADPGIGDAIDAIAWHPYPYPFVAPEVEIPANSSVPGSADQIRALLAARGAPGEELWVTEVGWPTHLEYGVSRQRQAAYLVRAFALLWAEGVPLVTWYTYSDGPNADHNQEDAFGLVAFDGTPKPAYHAVTTFTSLLGDDVLAGSRAGELGLAPDEHALAFEGPHERVTLLWVSPESTTTDYGPFDSTDGVRPTVVVPAHGKVRLVTMTGDVSELTAKGGHVSLEISPFPVYLIERTP